MLSTAVDHIAQENTNHFLTQTVYLFISFLNKHITRMRVYFHKGLRHLKSTQATPKIGRTLNMLDFFSRELLLPGKLVKRSKNAHCPDTTGSFLDHVTS